MNQKLWHQIFEGLKVNMKFVIRIKNKILYIYDNFSTHSHYIKTYLILQYSTQHRVISCVGECEWPEENMDTKVDLNIKYWLWNWKCVIYIILLIV
jgi:hypothetical protein